MKNGDRLQAHIRFKRDAEPRKRIEKFREFLYQHTCLPEKKLIKTLLNASTFAAFAKKVHLTNR